MGCSFGTPLSPPINAAQSTNERFNIKIGVKPSNVRFNTEIADEDQNQPREYFSFTSFISKNQNPTIFEWSFIREIGEGSKSHVFLAQNIQTGQQCAAKVYNKSLLMRQNLGSEEAPISSLQNEIDIMVAVTHKHSVPITEIIEDELSNSLIILSPLAKYGSLQSYIKNTKLQEIVLSICFYQIAEALRYIHSLQIVHRNITLANIFVFTETLYKISNFSDSTLISSPDAKLKDIKGSLEFLSPEECSRKPFYPMPADVWSYGVTLYYAAFKKLPFNLTFIDNQDDDIDKYVSQISNIFEKEELSFPDESSEDLKDILKLILVKDFKRRPTFDNIINHSWFDQAKEIVQMDDNPEPEYENPSINEEEEINNEEA